ncbi:MAG: LacI family DNA-binding transcriptional regulator [Akkermansiaceae bacterium]|nr:LacI family DNA-binding transcriptional regulator [Armatimonadota bacterium]
MTTIREVARASGVSPMTVSYVLNDPGRVHPDTRQRVLQAMRELGYRPPLSRSASDTEEDRRTTIGIIYSRWSRLASEVSYYSRILAGVLEAADDQGSHVTLFSHHTWTEDVSKSLRKYCDGRCDGLILIAPKIESELVTTLRERGMPFVIVGDSGLGPEDRCVDVDNVAAAYQITDHLLSLGHTNIAYLPGKDNVRPTHEREQGWRAAHAARGIVPRQSIPYPGGWTREYGYERAIIILKETDRPSAIFAMDDELAMGAMIAARELGLRIGRDLSVAGFDDVPEATQCDPPLTTISQPYTEIGARAVGLLLGTMRGGGGGRILLPGRMIIRASTGPSVGS